MIIQYKYTENVYHLLKIDSQINSHFVCKITTVFGFFVNRLCNLILERSLREQQI